jgi:hypothetical protein
MSSLFVGSQSFLIMNLLHINLMDIALMSMDNALAYMNTESGYKNSVLKF